MGNHDHFFSVCMFCILCFSHHVHCTEHGHHTTKVKVKERERSRSEIDSGAKLTQFTDVPPDIVSHRDRRHDNKDDGSIKSQPLQNIYIEKLFKKFSNQTGALDWEGVQQLLHSLGIHHIQRDPEIEIDTNKTCLEGDDFVEVISMQPKSSSLSIEDVFRLCPALLYHVAVPSKCDEATEGNGRLITWLYATCSVFIISLCGLFGVFVIPFMGKVGYQQVLQFLVALAVGTLSGDAMLHLLPHALFAHGHTHGGHDDHANAMWKGATVLLGIVLFFFTEKILMLGSEWRRRQLRNRRIQGHSHVQILTGNVEANGTESGEENKECKHKYSGYPYCYSDIKRNRDNHEHAHGDHTAAADVLQDNGSLLESGIPCDKKAGEYDVIVREHTTTHHGHSHSHGHVHSAPDSLSSVAWMVILGDGLHNFTDGMALGAAFANNVAGGCSTAVAVFCHELPHELGDFAVLLKTGMTCKQAVMYNLLSSVLCFVGMVIGMIVGNNPEATTWIFAASAGIFLYIAFIDMFPEMTSNHSAEQTTLCQCSLQGLGVITGVVIMLIIAYYEDTLLNLFS